MEEKVWLYYFANKGPSQGYGLPSGHVRCENWTIKKAEHQRIDAFELWCWKRLLKDPWTSRRSNQPILREINPEYSLEGLMLKLKLQYFGHLMWTTDSSEKSVMLGKIEGKKEKRVSEDEMAGRHYQCNEHEPEQTLGDGEGQGGLMCCRPWGGQESDTTGRLNNNTAGGNVKRRIHFRKQFCSSSKSSTGLSYNSTTLLFIYPRWKHDAHRKHNEYL